MNTNIHFKSNEEKTAFMCGLAFYLGYLKASNKELAFDANTNNPYWITTENGHHFLIDEEGEIQSGRFKNQPIDKLKDCSSEEKTQKVHFEKLSQAEYKARKKFIDKFKYNEKTPEKALNYLDSMIPEPRDDEKIINKRRAFNNQIDLGISDQPKEIQEKINAFHLNSEGVTEIPYVSDQIQDLLHLNSKRKIVLTLYQQRRALSKHDNMDSEGFARGLALCLMGKNLERVELESNSLDYSHIAVRIYDKVFGDIVIDFAKKNRFYEIVHFHPTAEKKVNRKRIR